jgi:MFS family permease
MGFFLLLPIPLLLIAKEPPYEIPAKFPWKDFKETFKKRIVWIILLFFILIEFGIYVIFAMMPLFLTLDLKLDLSLVGIVMAGGSFGFFIGCLVSGPIFDRLSRKMGIIISILILISAFFLVSLIQNFTMALIFVLLTGFAWGLFQIIQMIISMDITKKSISATMFSIFMSLYNFGQILGALFGAILVTTFGFRLAFILAAIIILPTLFLALLIKGTEQFNVESSEPAVK